MAALIKEVRRTIWRTFGCKPVTMGDSESTPRATAEVQLEAEDSGLIRPTLEMLQGALNTRVIPLLVGDPALAGVVEFRFPFERDLAPGDRKADAEADAVDFDRGVLTLNERRERRGMPAVDGGDVRLLRTGQGYVPLDVVVAGGTEDVATTDLTPTTAGPGEVEAGRPAPEQRAPKKYDHINFTPPAGVQDECARGVSWVEDGKGGDGLKPETVRWARRLADGEDITPDKARKMKAWLARHEVDKEAEGFRPGEEGYPSPGRVAWACWGGDPAVGWSKKLVEQMDAADREDKSRSLPTLRLRKIHVLDAPTNRAACECGSHFLARASDLLPSDWQPGGRFRGYRTINLASLGDTIMDYRADVWPLYRRCRSDVESVFRARVGSGPIESMTAAALLRDVRNELDALAERWSATTAPLYRRAAKVGRDAATEITRQPVASNWAERADAYAQRAMAYLVDNDGLIGTLSAELTVIVTAITRGTPANSRLSTMIGRNNQIDKAAVLSAVAKVFARNEHRIDNWSGKMVELGNVVFSDGAIEGGAPPEDPTDPTSPGQEWYVEWVAVGDDATCATCTTQSARGFVPARSLPTVPGGATECMARDRCVLVWWKKSEVDSGAAVRLSG